MKKVIHFTDAEAELHTLVNAINAMAQEDLKAVRSVRVVTLDPRENGLDDAELFAVLSSKRNLSRDRAEELVREQATAMGLFPRPMGVTSPACDSGEGGSGEDDSAPPAQA